MDKFWGGIGWTRLNLEQDAASAKQSLTGTKFQGRKMQDWQNEEENLVRLFRVMHFPVLGIPVLEISQSSLFVTRRYFVRNNNSNNNNTTNNSNINNSLLNELIISYTRVSVLFQTRFCRTCNGSRQSDRKPWNSSCFVAGSFRLFGFYCEHGVPPGPSRIIDHIVLWPSGYACSCK